MPLDLPIVSANALAETLRFPSPIPIGLLVVELLNDQTRSKLGRLRHGRRCEKWRRNRAAWGHKCTVLSQCERRRPAGSVVDS